MKPKLIINGAAGRMGKRILSLAIAAAELEIVAAVDSKDHPDIGKDVGVLAGTSPVNVKLTAAYPPRR